MKSAEFLADKTSWKTFKIPWHDFKNHKLKIQNGVLEKFAKLQRDDFMSFSRFLTVDLSMKETKDIDGGGDCASNVLKKLKIMQF